MSTVFQQIGPYRILRQIGHGGMAVVFLAVDTRMNRQVALKLVQQGHDREAREIVAAERFGAELQKQFSERGAHVPAVYEYGVDEDSGYFYVAMEYLDGENLSELISRGALPPERAVEVGIELARFLDDAHAFEAVVNGRNLQSLLHLDLKPRNVRITSAQQVKVLDFGTAKALSVSRKVTRNDFGSVAYLSPERLETGEVDGRADLWALGVVLYEMLRGTPPFQAADTRRLERLILSRRPPPSLADECPNGLAAIVAKLLHPQAADRYATAREIRDDLERFKSGQQTVAEASGWPVRAYDDEATRRTSPVLSNDSPGAPKSATSDSAGASEDDDDAKTRRTVPPPLPNAVLPPPIPRAVPLPPLPDFAPATPPRRRRGFFRRQEQRADTPRPPRSKSYQLFRAALVLIGLGLTANEISVGHDAGRLARAASTRDFDGLPQAWREYENLAARSHFNAAGDVERALTNRTIELVKQVTANYLTPTPTVREAQWVAARDALVRALTIAGNEPGLRAYLRLCEGHLHRINGEARKAREDIEGAEQEFTDAVVAFREAAQSLGDWPDPFVGLARTFLVGLDDVERGAQALAEAARYGHEPTPREAAVLADGYRTHGNALVRTARQLDGLPQEQEYLNRAAEAFRLALENYAKAGNLGTVPQNVGRTQRALVQVEEVLATYSPSDDTGESTPAGSSATATELPFQGAAVFGNVAP